MKKYFSWLGLFARGSLLKSILIIAATCASQAGLLYLRCRFLAKDGEFMIEECVYHSGVGIALLVGFLLLTVLLCFSGSAPGTSYTVERLRANKIGVFGMQAVSAFLIYLMFWAAEICLFYAFGCWFVRTVSPLSGEQAIFLAFFRSDLLHSLLPLETPDIFARNVMFAVSMALTSAEASMLARDKRYSYTVLPAAAVIAVLFVREFYSEKNILTAAIILGVVLLKLTWDFFTGKGNEPDEEPDDEIIGARDAS